MNVNYSMNKGALVEKSTHKRVYFSLILRSLLFIVTGFAIVGIVALAGFDNPIKAAEKWWPYQAIAANILTFFIIRHFLKKEGLSYKSMFAGPPIRGWKKVQEYAILLVAGIVGGAVPLYVSSYLILGSFIPPATHFQELPVLFAAIALIVFPLTNALVELPLYIGYALPRLSGKTSALLLVSLGLALQHAFLPLVFEADYMLWRVVAFIPLAIIVGFIFAKTKRLWPIVVVHFLMDLQLVIQIFINSIG
ncbi:hypothetical protein A8F94_09215 [Bacillus sp. FJAT-27225]|uniref:CPBP family glutamic-type intramembrane protease n=1 Tax=Bacillus sp. FJAT-27225 TaxID=1743144 RepID=UPI00080C24F4|nr:CPBP family glutamic-type intramembrane protease [Bacillus sp. FJAT-27225]OCA87997.1 hypothetical protein A8F94_09215 [Bacillus sp. FJAT-27225]